MTRIQWIIVTALVVQIVGAAIVSANAPPKSSYPSLISKYFRLAEDSVTENAYQQE